MAAEFENSRSKVYEMVRIIEAQREGICGICGKPYPAGTRILKDPKTGKWVEADCYFPAHKRVDAHPEAITSGQGSTDRQSPPSQALPSMEEELAQAEGYAKRLYDMALKLGAEKNPEWKDMSEEPYLIAVLIQTMHGHITSMRIAKQETEKLKAYGGKF